MLLCAGIGYRLLKGVKYKSGPCATMIVAKADINRASADAGTPGDRGENPATRTAQAEAKVRLQRADCLAHLSFFFFRHW